MVTSYEGRDRSRQGQSVEHFDQYVAAYCFVLRFHLGARLGY